MNKELTLAEKFHNAWTNLYADDEIREVLTGEECKVMDEVETTLKEKEQDKKKLKALEIIKEWFEVFEDENGYHIKTTFRALFDSKRIDKETFDLLKEMLK